MLQANPVWLVANFLKNLYNTPGAGGMSQMTPQAMIVDPKAPLGALGSLKYTQDQKMEKHRKILGFLKFSMSQKMKISSSCFPDHYVSTQTFPLPHWPFQLGS